VTPGSGTIARVKNLLLSIGAFAVSALSCGGGTGGSRVNGGAGDFRATIDGQSWVADANTVQVTADAKAPGVLAITGTHVTSASNYLSLELALGFLNGPKTYPLGVNAGTNAGGSATVFQQQGSTTGIWATDFSGDRGSLTVTVMGNGQLAGTFLFTAPPQLGSTVTNDRTVTNGIFNLALPAAFQPAAADDYGSSITATINGQAWNGATVTGVGDTSTGALSFGGSSTSYLLNLTTATPVQAGQTYDQTAITMSASDETTPGKSWAGSGSVVSLTVSSLTTKRIIGTFSATLPPVGAATTPLTITSGTFDVRIDPP